MGAALLWTPSMGRKGYSNLSKHLQTTLEILRIPCLASLSLQFTNSTEWHRMWYSPGLERSQDSLRKTTCHCLKTIAASTSQTFALRPGSVFLHHWRPFKKKQILELRQLQTSCTRSSATKWFSLALQQSFARKSTLAAKAMEDLPKPCLMYVEAPTPYYIKWNGRAPDL